MTHHLRIAAIVLVLQFGFGAPVYSQDYEDCPSCLKDHTDICREECVEIARAQQAECLSKCSSSKCAKNCSKQPAEKPTTSSNLPTKTKE